MEPYSLYEAESVENSYALYGGLQSQNSPEIHPYFLLRNYLKQPEHDSSQEMREDLTGLAEMLSPVHVPEERTLVEQVFGNQSSQQKHLLRHGTTLLKERARLHRQHLRELDHQHRHLQRKMPVTRPYSIVDNRQKELGIERMLLQLEQQKRQLELDFWKDSMDLRDKLFETAGEYQAIRHRTYLLEDVETDSEGGGLYG